MACLPPMRCFAGLGGPWQRRRQREPTEACSKIQPPLFSEVAIAAAARAAAPPLRWPVKDPDETPDQTFQRQDCLVIAAACATFCAFSDHFGPSGIAAAICCGVFTMAAVVAYPPWMAPRPDPWQDVAQEEQQELQQVPAAAATASRTQPAPELDRVPEGALAGGPELGSTRPVAEDLRHHELRRRLADLLQGDDAQLSMERMGGEQTCFARFLNVAGGKVAQAEKLLRNTLAFRAENGVNHILEDSHALEVWAEFRPLWPANVAAFNRRQSPVTYFRMAHMMRMWERGLNEERMRTYYICWCEKLLALEREGHRRQGSEASEYMPGSYDIFDLQGVGLAHWRCLPGLRMMARTLGIGQTHYPGIMQRAVLINIPAVGFKMAWPVVQRTLDHNIQEMLSIGSAEDRQGLAETLLLSTEEVDVCFRSVTPYHKSESTQAEGTGETSILHGPDLMA